MLTRLSAEGAAAAAAAVVASAASVASEAARGFHGRRRAGRCLPEAHSGALPFLRALEAIGGNETVRRLRWSTPLPSRVYRPARLLPSKPRATSDATEVAKATTAAAAAAAPSADERVSICGT